MYPEVKFYLVKSGGLTCAMKIYMRNRTCAAPSCLWTLEFYADLLQWRCKSETSPGFEQIWYSFPDDALVWLVFFLFKYSFSSPLQKHGEPVLTVSIQAPTPGVHAEDTRAGAPAAGQPPSYSPRHERHLPSTILLLLCFTRVSGVWPWCFRCSWSWPQGLT